MVYYLYFIISCNKNKLFMSPLFIIQEKNENQDVREKQVVVMHIHNPSS